MSHLTGRESQRCQRVCILRHDNRDLGAVHGANDNTVTVQRVFVFTTGPVSAQRRRGGLGHMVSSQLLSA